jgi:hypothetical protein
LFEMVELQPLSGRCGAKSGTMVNASNPMRLSTRNAFISATSFKVKWSQASELTSAGIGPLNFVQLNEPKQKLEPQEMNRITWRS